MNTKKNVNRYDAQQREKYWQNFWQEEKIFAFDPNSDKPLYTIDTPPPTISGSLHLGHVYSYSQAEIIARYKRLAGYNVRYPFGYDNNGLPTERLVEKEKQILGRKMPLEEFVSICLEVTKHYAKEFESLWKSIGLSVDWNLTYSTIDSEVQKLSQSVFLDLLEQGIVYRDSSPTLFCVECGTAVAQAEVEDKIMSSVFYDLAFTLKNTGEVIPIATTRPELLPACTAVFVHPDDQRYTHLIGEKIITPLGVEVEILADNKVSMDKGTGVVMCCTYGDETDRYWVKKHGLEERTIINDKGIIEGSILEEENGKTILQARDFIVKYLEDKGKILKSVPIEHSVGVHERCSTPMELILRDQWLVKILDKKEELLAAGEKINWYPAFMQTRYNDWVKNLKWDWNISRDRYFGIPIPVFHCQSCSAIIPAQKDELPIDPRTDQKDRLCPNCQTSDLKPEYQVLDTWFTSALTPDINNQHKNNVNLQNKMYPMSMRPMAHDIIRTWGVYTILMGHYRHNDIPWHDLMISGHILLKKGEKISKKTGGGKYKPQQLIQEYSADSLRYAMCGANLGKDGFFDLGEVKKGKKLVNKLYNAGKFVLSHLKDYDPANNVPDKLEFIDKWIIEESKNISFKMAQYFDKYEYSHARQKFETFFWSIFTDNYLEIVKGRLYQQTGDTRTSAQYTLYTVFLNILKMATPFVPHITEELYHAYLDTESNLLSAVDKGYYFEKVGEKSINNLLWNKDKPDIQENQQQVINYMLKIIEQVRKYKTEHKLGLSSEIKKIEILSSLSLADLLSPVIADIKFVTKVKELSFSNSSKEEIEIKVFI